jgi:hypothetical protein
VTINTAWRLLDVNCAESQPRVTHAHVPPPKPQLETKPVVKAKPVLEAKPVAPVTPDLIWRLLATHLQTTAQPNSPA